MLRYSFCSTSCSAHISTDGRILLLPGHPMVPFHHWFSAHLNSFLIKWHQHGKSCLDVVNWTSPECKLLGACWWENSYMLVRFRKWRIKLKWARHGTYTRNQCDVHSRYPYLKCEYIWLRIQIGQSSPLPTRLAMHHHPTIVHSRYPYLKCEYIWLWKQIGQNSLLTTRLAMHHHPTIHLLCRTFPILDWFNAVSPPPFTPPFTDPNPSNPAAVEKEKKKPTYPRPILDPWHTTYDSL
jgi:hypothetical protein